MQLKKLITKSASVACIQPPLSNAVVNFCFNSFTHSLDLTSQSNYFVFLTGLFWFSWCVNNSICFHFCSQPLTGQFLQPYQNANNCSVHRSCLSCMTNAACGWCASSCISRNTSEGFCFDPVGNQRNLTLNLSACTVCSDHIDCFSCNQVITLAIDYNFLM